MRRFLSLLVIVLWLVLAFTPLIIGWNYYTTPVAERAHHIQHELFKPTGLVGHGLGILGSLMIITGVSTYSIRKRFKSLQRLGKLNFWLRFHIFLCTLGPFWVLLHTTFKISGIVAIAFWSMTLVVASGIFGRYVYARIPKTLNGVFLEAKDIEEKISQLKNQLGEVAGLGVLQLEEAGIKVETGNKYSVRKALMSTLKLDMNLYSYNKLQSLKQYRALSEVQQQKTKQLAKELIWVSRQKDIKEPFQRVFGYWHVFHIPLTAVMFIILILHIIVSILFGYTWIF